MEIDSESEESYKKGIGTRGTVRLRDTKFLVIPKRYEGSEGSTHQ